MNLEYDYQPTDIEDEVFVSEVPVELLISSIQTQFNEPLEYRKKDYVQSFITKYDFCKNNLLEDDLMVLDNLREKFLRFMINIFYEKLSIGFPNIDDEDEETQHELIHLTYRFFIKNIKKNFINIIINYITDNKNDIINNYEKKKDVTALNFKNEIDDDYDIFVLSNLGDIIDGIMTDLGSTDDVDYFLNLCESDEPILELDYVKDAYNNLDITGNFIKDYINMIDDEFLMEIQAKVRNKILKKYPKRTSKEIYNDDMTNESDE